MEEIKKQISAATVIEMLKSGNYENREEILDKLGIDHKEGARMFKHPVFAGIRLKKKKKEPEFSFDFVVDVVEETETVEDNNSTTEEHNINNNLGQESPSSFLEL